MKIQFKLMVFFIFTLVLMFPIGCASPSSSSSREEAATSTKSWSAKPVIGTDEFNTDNSEDANNPKIAIDNNGNAVIVWAQDDGTNVNIYKRAYRDATWSSKPDVTTDAFNTDNNYDVTKHQVTMDNNGNTIIAWAQDDGTNDNIYKRAYRNETWDAKPAIATEQFNTDNDQHVYNPQVVMDDSNNAVIVWSQYDDGVTYYNIYEREYRDGTWSAQPDVTTDAFNTDNGKFADNSRVAMDNNGNIIIIWNQRNDTGAYNNNIYMREYRDGTWDAKPDVTADAFNMDNGLTTSTHQVVIDNNGNAIIAWVQYDSGSFTSNIYIREYRNGSWTAKPDVATGQFNIDNDNVITEFSVAIDNNGNAIIVWAQSDASNDTQIYKREYRDGSWSAKPDLTTGTFNTDNNVGAASPQVAMDNNGNAIIVWRQGEDGDNYNNIYMREYRDGVWSAKPAIGDPFNTEPTGIQDSATSPQVAMDNKGNAVITWTQSVGDDAYTNIYLREYR